MTADDFRSKAEAVVNRGYNVGLIEAVANALMAEHASSQEEIARLRKALVIANAQLADMEFLTVEGFLSWKSDRRAASQPVPEHGDRG